MSSKAAAQGNTSALQSLQRAAYDPRDPDGAFYLGAYFEATRENDLDQAYRWYGKAASYGHQEAMNRLRRDAENNIPLAQVQLGLLYEYGQVVSQSYTEAKKWYETAAELKLAGAIRYLSRSSEKAH